MGTLERRERGKAELRQKILDAARALFVTRGAEAVTMRKIAASIEYSPTAIYDYFPDKESLMRALCAHDFTALLVEGVHLLKERDPVKRLLDTGKVYIEFALRHPHQYQYMFMTPSSIEPSNPALDSFSMLRNTVAQAVASGQLRSDWQDVDLISHTLCAALHGVASLHIAGRYKHLPNSSPEQIVEAALKNILAGLQCEPAAVRGAKPTQRATRTLRTGPRRSPAPKERRRA